MTSRTRTARLRDVMDDLTEDISRESYGRRREVALRLRLITREEYVVEQLRILIQRMQDGLNRSSNFDDPEAPSLDAKVLVESTRKALATVTQLLESVDGAVGSEKPWEGKAEVQEGWSNGSLARVIASQDAVTTLVDELQSETERRLKLEVKLAEQIAEEARKSGTTEGSPLAGETRETTSKETLVNSESLSASPPEELKRPTSPATPRVRAVEQAPPEPVEEELQLPSISHDATEVSLASPIPPEDLPQLADEDDIPDSPVVHPLLAQLVQVASRYTNISKAFRDCHSTLAQLTINLQNISSPEYQSPGSAVHLLHTFLARLNDFSEDCRVELEIRIADEERLAKGFETILSVSDATSMGDGLVGVEEKIAAFVDASDPNVAKAQENFTRKLSDLEHDIALLKRAVHEVAFSAPTLDGQEVPAPVSSSPWTRMSGLLSTSNTLRPASPVGGLIGTTRRRSSSTSINALDLTAPASDSGRYTPIDIAELPFRIEMPRPSTRSPTPTRQHPFMPTFPSFNARLQNQRAVSSPMALTPRSSVSNLSIRTNGRHHSHHSPRPSFGEQSRTVSAGMYRLGLGAGVGSHTALSSELSPQGSVVETSESDLDTDLDTRAETEDTTTDVE